MAARRARIIAIRCFSTPPSNSDLYQNGMPLLARAAEHAQSGRILAYDWDGAPYSYHDVLSKSSHLHKFFKQKQIKQRTSADDPPQRVAFLCDPGHRYVYTQFACWSSGSVAVPLCISHTSNQFRYVLQDSDPSLIIDGTSNTAGSSELQIAAKEVGVLDRCHRLDDLMLGFDSR